LVLVDIRLKLFATYRRYLPPDSQGSAYDTDVPAGTRAVDLLVQFSVPADDGASVILINGRSTGSKQILEDGDIVAVFPAMAGG